MFRPTGFADLAGRRVGVFGYGIEGHATESRLRLLGAHCVLVDDDPDAGVLVTGDGGIEALATCDVVVKSPGIARRRRDVLELESRVPVTSALNLWLLDADRSRVIGVTGTKGKSTTTALVDFFLGCLGEHSQRLGNIGLPPYDPSVDTSVGWCVVEISSYQCVDVTVSPRVVVVTSLGADHLDWHGGLAQYQRDKLSLTRAAGAHVTIVPDVTELTSRIDELGGEVVVVPPDDSGLASRLHLLGAHNDQNVAIAIETVARATGRDRREVLQAALAHADGFEPLAGRLTLIARERDGERTWRYVDDGLATAPLPTVAALEVFADDPVALIVGGFDRGVDYGPLARAVGDRRAATTLITTGDVGARIGATVAANAPAVTQYAAADLDDAVGYARAFLAEGGVVLLSPAAPSFDHYRNWEARSADFARAVRARTGSLGRDSNP